MFKDIDKKRKRHKEIEGLIADPKVISNSTLYQKYAKEFAQLSKLIGKCDELESLDREISDTEAVLKEQGHDDSFMALARQELEGLTAKRASVVRELEDFLLSEEDPNSGKDIILEIRAGTGGLEAALFAADLFRMYSKYAQQKGWRIEVMSSNITEKGGFKEVIFSVNGTNVYDQMKFESGTHRVQRVPETEASGRIHTSAATVAVLPEADEVDVTIDQKDLKIDVYRASGAGGQSVNKTESAVRITHIPSGLVVSCQDERSQHKNKGKALRILRARVFDHIKTQHDKKISKDRKKQVGSGDRSEKIRTYNFPDSRVTDHRIGLTLHKLEEVLEGNLDEITAALKKEDRRLRLGAV